MIKKVGIVANTSSPLAGEGVRTLAGWLEENKLGYSIDIESARVAGMPHGFTKKEIADTVDMVVALGGDGTLLSVARMVMGRQTPLLGVNLGALGFLTVFTYEEMIPAMEMALKGDYKCDDRIMLDVSISRDGIDIASNTVLNDIVITRGALAGMVSVEVRAGKTLVNSYTADGLIIATPTGSTAYNLSAGGPIIYPTLNALIISPICPHTLSNRPIVMPDDLDIELRLVPGHTAESVITLDGQVGFQLNTRDRILVKRSKDITSVIRSPFCNYYELLRSKLKWGENIRNDYGKQ